MKQAVALIRCDLEVGGLGLPSHVFAEFAGQPVLRHTLARVSEVEGIREVIVIASGGNEVSYRRLAELCQFADVELPVRVIRSSRQSTDPYQRMRISGRRWHPDGWRGGLGGLTCYDELLPAVDLVAAMKQAEATSALLLGAEWAWLDAQLSSTVLKAHLDQAEDMKLTFCQAPPGLSGIACHVDLLEDIANNVGSSFGQLLGYQPTHPQADPIGKDICIACPPALRDLPHRFIYDLPRSRHLMDVLSSSASHKPIHAGNLPTLVNELPDDICFATPRHVTLELTAKRLANGPATVQSKLQLARKPMPVEQARQFIKKVADLGDATLTLGGLGDPLLHDHWVELVDYAGKVGVFALALRTDLLTSDAQLPEQLLDLPIDVISPAINADCAETYRQVMEVDRFAEVTGCIEKLINLRNRRALGEAQAVETDKCDALDDLLPELSFTKLDDELSPADKTAIPESAHDLGYPWIVPRMVRCEQTLVDMENFYDRWTHFAGQAVIEPLPAVDADSLLSPTRGGLVHLHKLPVIQRLEALTRLSIYSDGQLPWHEDDLKADNALSYKGSHTFIENWLSLCDARVQRLSQASSIFPSIMAVA